MIGKHRKHDTVLLQKIEVEPDFLELTNLDQWLRSHDWCEWFLYVSLLLIIEALYSSKIILLFVYSRTNTTPIDPF